MSIFVIVIVIVIDFSRARVVAAHYAGIPLVNELRIRVFACILFTPRRLTLEPSRVYCRALASTLPSRRE